MPIGHPIYVDEKYPEIAKQFVNPEEAHVGLQSEKETQFICKYCYEIFTDKIRNVTRRGTVTCVSCREHGISYPEKFMCSLLDQLNIKFNLHYYSFTLIFHLQNTVFYKYYWQLYIRKLTSTSIRLCLSTCRVFFYRFDD
mgnify:CR=1 FL=1